MQVYQKLYETKISLFKTLQKFSSLEKNAHVAHYDNNWLTIPTSESEEPVSTHTNIGINVDVNAGAAIVTR